MKMGERRARLEGGMGRFDLLRHGDRHGGVMLLARERAGDGDGNDARIAHVTTGCGIGMRYLPSGWL
jgi:hypothetical protein